VEVVRAGGVRALDERGFGVGVGLAVVFVLHGTCSSTPSHYIVRRLSSCNKTLSAYLSVGRLETDGDDGDGGGLAAEQARR